MSRRALLGAVASTAAVAACSAPAVPPPPSPVLGRRSPGATPRDKAAPTASSPHQPVPDPATEPSGDLLHGSRSGNAVALTFHGAGDPALTHTALRHLGAAKAGCTVLAVGVWLSANPALAREILDHGHELGNHTWSHQTMTRLGASSARREVERAATLLTTLTGSAGRWFRPSGTPRSTPTIRAAATAAGYHRCLAYDVDPLDYLDPGADLVTTKVLSAARPGSIISLHLGHAGTVAALPSMLAGLQRKGLAAVTVSHLVDGQDA